MKINKNEISQFNKMIKACSLDDAVSDEFKLFQKKRKKAIYKRILIRLGIYSFISGIGVSIFFGVKKISVIIGTKALIATVAVAVSASSVIIYQIIEKPATVAVKIITESRQETAAPAAAEKIETKIVHFTLGLQPFRTESADPETVSRTNRYMLQSFKNLKKGSYAEQLGKIGEEQVSYIVNQSIEKTGNKYYIQIKIIDKNTSAIIYASKGTADSENSIQAACDDLARQVVSAVK